MDALPADEDDHVVAHSALIVENVAAQARIYGEHSFKRRSNRPSRNLARRS